MVVLYVGMRGSGVIVMVVSQWPCQWCISRAWEL